MGDGYWVVHHSKYSDKIGFKGEGAGVYPLKMSGSPEIILNLVYGTETMTEKGFRSFEDYLVK